MIITNTFSTIIITNKNYFFYIIIISVWCLSLIQVTTTVKTTTTTPSSTSTPSVTTKTTTSVCAFTEGMDEPQYITDAQVTVTPASAVLNAPSDVSHQRAIILTA
jgi:uncharacterized membrane protein YcgQ (UPF0703/DUF1980 family)